MITQTIDDEEEFLDPNINFKVLMNKIKIRIQNLEEDLICVKDPVVKGFITRELLELREKYFDYLKIDIDLQHLMLSNPDIYGGGNTNETV